MKECIFCKIVKKEVKSKIIFENELIVAFEDAFPVAPVHILIIPKLHIDSMNYVKEHHKKIFGEIYCTIPSIAKQLNIAKEGYRLVLNNGINAGQEVKHIHVHLIGGKRLQKI